MKKRKDSASPNATKSDKQPKPKSLPEGPSTMQRIAKGGNKVMALAERVKKRGAARGYPKGW